MKYELAALLALAGCGSDSKATPDAPDAIDAAPVTPDAPTSGVATFTLTNLGISGANVPVSIADASGTPTAVVMTDANGMASGTVVAGGSMTAILGTAVNTTAIVVLDVHPGDHLKVSGNSSNPTSLGTAKVTYAAHATAGSISVSAGTCSASGAMASTTASVALDTGCVSAGNTYDINAYALDAQSRPIAYQSAFDLVPPAMGVTSAVGLGAWRTDFVGFSIAIANAPTGTTKAIAQIQPRHNNFTFQSDSTSKALAATMGTSFDLVVPKGSWSAYTYEVGVSESNKVASTVIRQPATLNGLVSIDLSTELLPFVHGISFDLASGKTTPTLHFMPDRAVTASGILSQLSYKTAGGTLNAFVVMPPTASGAITLPALPDTLSAYRPLMPFNGAVNAVDLLASAALWPDAKTFRENWFSVLSGGLTPPVGGEITFSASQP